MAVPKKRTGHSAQGHRRSNWKATKPETTKCPNCGATVLAHTVCTECGTYKGKPVSLKDREAQVLVKEEKKTTKKAAKTAEKEVQAEAKTEAKTEKKTAKKSTKTEAKTKAKTEAKAEKEEKTEE
ncbi:50S ribosomal protein L32 [bacterium]|nr:50S ribosomal protein L32 [bacterium]